VIRNYLNANADVPWKDVKYIICEVMYGGHITDKWDRRVCAAYLEEIMKPEIFSGMALAPGFIAPPPDEEYEFYRNYIEEKFPLEGPAQFGLHNNAEIGFLLATADALFTIIVDLSGAGAGGGGAADEGKVGRYIKELEDKLPDNFDYITLDQRAVERTPYQCVILQEVERMNKLLTLIRTSLGELALGLAGALNMSDAMDALATSLTVNRVPANWATVAHPSLKTLAPWFADLLLRCAQLKAWSDSLLTPTSVWISGLFNPMAYITAILQTTARVNDLALDQMEVWTDITAEYSPENFEEYPEDGMYIHGCCMEGAQWDSKKNVVADSAPKDLHPAMPVILVRGVEYDKVDKTGIFECPVFVTTSRGGTFTFIATLRTNDPVNKWVLAGVAIMMSDDIAA
jgi:dynein heavy chain